MKRVLCWALLFALLAACGDTLPRTQVMLVIDAEPGVRAQTDEVQIVIRGGTGAMAQWQERLDRTFAPGDNAEWPMELALVPIGNDATRVYEATATALSTTGDPIARVRAISGYRKGKTLVLRLLFEDACRAQVEACNATQTCRSGACVDADVEVTSLDTFKPGVGSDAGGTGGGGSVDAGIDSGVDAGVDSGDASTDSGVDAADINECLSPNVCTVDYPCQDLADGYTCRGQFPDWRVSSAPTFTDNGDGTVTDDRSGLRWQRDVDAGAYTWEDAKAYCEGLSLAGRVWRLPAKSELESLIDDSRYFPSIDPDAFPSTPPDFFWSSSPVSGPAGSAWDVAFNEGSSNNGNSTGRLSRVRCVHTDVVVVASAGSGGAPPSRYEFPTSGTVYDVRTHLTWEQTAGGGTRTQGAAIDYCAGLSLDGDGWRLPTRAELLTLVDPTQSGPAIDPSAFVATPATYFWSSTPAFGDASLGWIVSFYYGNSIRQGANSAVSARCVR